MDDCSYLLNAIIGGGELDYKKLVKTMGEWNIDAEDVVEDVKSYSDNVDISALFLSTYTMHANELKEQIAELCEDLVNEDGDIKFDEEKLDNYEVQVYVNYSDTSYNKDNELFSCKDIDEMKKTYLDKLVDFLIDEEIVEVDNACRKVCIGVPEPEDIDENDYEDCLDDCNEYGAAVEYLKNLIGGEK